MASTIVSSMPLSVEKPTFGTRNQFVPYFLVCFINSGLLGGHVLATLLKKKRKGLLWYHDELLEKAKDLGYRLLPSFNTTTGVPFPRVICFFVPLHCLKVIVIPFNY